ALVAELAEARPLRDNAFKVDLTCRLALDVLGELTARRPARTG
ncbi:xanthine dehydrogenase family protein subunit M, partial [Streptomyces anulatus]|nr:xanthine dehydrogenase family protein subunit M [Streptomyces anulatus]